MKQTLEMHSLMAACFMVIGAIYCMQWMQHVAAPVTHKEMRVILAEKSRAAFEREHYALRFENPSLNKLAYPVPSWVHTMSFSIDPALVLAIVKKESNFNQRAISKAGAKGLMQLMPDTAKYIAAKTNSNVPSRAALAKPSVNIALGQSYLSYLAEKPYIDGDIVYLLTAYNAGPGNLKKWQKRFDGLEGDEFAAAIPFKETRRYVQKVMEYYRAYQEVLHDQSVGIELATTIWAPEKRS